MIDLIRNYGFELIELVVFGLLFYFLERINPAERDTKFFKSDMNNEVAFALINLFIFVPLTAFLAVLLVEMTLKPLIGYQLFANEIESLPLAIQILFGALLLDFSTYWRHRFTHFYMWSYHSVHHSAKQMTWITGLRLHPLDLLASALLSSFLLYIFGFSGVGFLGAIIIVKFMNYFTHVNMNLKFGKPLRYILCSPVFHRWHHATVKEAYDKNFCGVFPFFDLMFGTYYHPEELPENYGLSPGEQKNFPERSTFGWLIYPFKRDLKLWKRRREKKNKVPKI